MVDHFAFAALPAMINIRGDSGDHAFAAAAESALGMALPQSAGEVVRSGSRRLAWLGPDEWLLLDEGGDAAAIEQGLAAALEGQHMSACDVTGNRVLIRLAAPDALALLARGCALDLETLLAGGRCVQTMLARAQVLIIADTDGTIDLFPRRSFAGYMREWLAAAVLRHAA